MNLGFRILACAAAALALTSQPAEARGRHAAGPAALHGVAYHGGAHWAVRGGGGHRWHGGYWGPGVFIGGLGLGIGIAALSGVPYYPGYYAGYYPVPAYPGVVVEPAAPPAAARPAAPAAAPDPIIYPRNGQSPAQTEADRQACNRWATTQPQAMADASVFQRATGACMDGRGYTLR